MHDLREGQFKIFFGGSYRENWAADYTMSVSYSERRFVLSERIDGRWKAVGGDEELCESLNSPYCPKTVRQYFEGASESFEALHECIRRGLPVTKLGEFFHSTGNPITAPELARVLMDDCGFPLLGAYRTAAWCCDDICASDVDIAHLSALQPRTAQVVSLLRSAFVNSASVTCDSRDSFCRFPYGAVRQGEEVKLSFRQTGGRISAAFLVVYGNESRFELPMEHSGRVWFCALTLPEIGAYRYCFRIESVESTRWLCPDESGFIGKLFGTECPGFRLTVFDKDFDTPEWFKSCIMYQIFPDRFGFSDDGTAQRGVEYHKSLGQRAELHASIDAPVRYLPREFEKEYIPDDFYGGTFKGIEKKLPYLKKLGISCIYLNPIVEARSNHRYDASDYLRPDPILGSLDDFDALVKAAENMGIRIILDGVFSHTGADSIYFNKYGHYDSIGACQGKASPYYDWFDFKSFPDDYRSWWGFKELPEVEETNSEWQDFVVTGENSVVKTWLRRGAAGWRLDVADELPDEVLTLIRKSAKEEKSDALVLGEVWEDAVIKESYGLKRNYALGVSLDSVMNYPLRTALLDFIHGRTDAYALRNFLISQQMNYPRPLYYSLMNLLGSHDVERLRNALAADTDIRSLSREKQLALDFSEETLSAAIEKEKLCAAVQFSLPGVPSIYYGDEQGMCGVNDPFNRLPFKEEDNGLYEYYVNLSNLRTGSPALSVGEAEFSAPCSDVLVILRYIKGGDAFLTVVNRGGKSHDYEVNCVNAGRGIVKGHIGAISAEIIRL
ncbi:MAG: glycoside hydrolase family 13 protein [Eubacteriales bacterium]|nr:glycoside hydrolase family 13 protein [Eubacteriales bacterium]